LDRLLKIEDPSPVRRRDAVVLSLRNIVTPTLDPKIGLLTVAVRTENAQLSQEIAVRVLNELTQFNRERLQSRAAAERRFTESQLAVARSELRAAEDQVQAFLQDNRDY